MPNRLISFIFSVFLVTVADAQTRQQMNGFPLTNLRIPAGEIRHGGPPRDGIPAIDHPRFAEAGEADFLKKEEEVLGVTLNGEARAYPIRILNYHEIVNDYLGGEPVVVTYCPLCGSGIAFRAGIDGERRTFGVSGLLYNSDVLLYDRQTESLWSQIGMEAVSGPAAGEQLRMLPTEYTTWADWKERHPDTRVLTPDTGHRRDYTRTPYAGYEQSIELMFPVAEESDRLPRKEKVLGVKVGDTFKAYPFSELKKVKGPVTDKVNGRRLTIHYDPAARSARATDGAGEPYPAVTLYWFAWYAFHPKTSVYES